MELLFEEHQTNGLFLMRTDDGTFKNEVILNDSTINTIVYNKKQPQTVTIDEASYTFPSYTILPLVASQYFSFEKPENLIFWQFNRNFYCIADHDAEVGCAGFLFYGIRHPLFVRLNADDMAQIELLEELCANDMKIKDRMQGEMLRTLLKRLIINITRIARKQTKNLDQLTDEKLDTVRMFNLLLEGHYKTEHAVQFYAQALNKSPKTLSNLFALLNYPSPSKLIQERIILEAKRFLYYTDKSAKEIAYALGFSNPAHFSRFFKQHTHVTISTFKKVSTL